MRGIGYKRANSSHRPLLWMRLMKLTCCCFAHFEVQQSPASQTTGWTKWVCRHTAVIKSSKLGLARNTWLHCSKRNVWLCESRRQFVRWVVPCWAVLHRTACLCYPLTGSSNCSSGGEIPPCPSISAQAACDTWGDLPTSSGLSVHTQH